MTPYRENIGPLCALDYYTILKLLKINDKSFLII